MGQKTHPLGIRLKSVETKSFFKKTGLFNKKNIFYFFYRHSFQNKSIIGSKIGQSNIIEQVITASLIKILCFVNRISIVENAINYCIIVEYYPVGSQIDKKVFIKQQVLLEYHLSSFLADKKKIQFFIIDLSSKILKSSKQALPIFKSNLIKNKNITSALVSIGLLSNFWPSALLFARVFSFFFKKSFEHQRFLDFTDNLFSFLYNLESSNFQGIRLEIRGRLNGSDRTKARVISQGSLPLQSLTRIQLNYGFANSVTSYGNCGIRIFFCYKN
jgi:hypothetical protein